MKRNCRLRLPVWRLLLGIWIGAVSAPGQLLQQLPGAGTSGARSGSTPSRPDARSATLQLQELEAKLAEARTSLAADEARGDVDLTNAPPGISPQDMAVQRTLLQRLVRLLEQQISNAADLDTAKARRIEVASQAQAWSHFPEPPPYSILLTDRLREEIQAERFKTTSSEATLSTIDQLMAEIRIELSRAEERSRQLTEKLEGVKEPGTAASLSRQRQLERLRSQVAAASLGVLDAERQLRQESLAESRVRLDWLQRQLVVAEANAQFTQADLDRVTARIEGDRQQLERELTQAQAQCTTAQHAVDAAREELRRILALPDADSASKARATEALATREVELETAQAAIGMLRLLVETEGIERTMWETRFVAHDSRNVTTLSEAERRLEQFIRRSDLWKDFEQQQKAVSLSQIDLQETRLRNLPADSELVPLARERLDALRERDRLLLRLVRRLEQVQLLSQRWAEELHEAEVRLPFFGRLQNLFSDAGSFLRKLWVFELFTAEDTITVEGQKITGIRSVTLGKVVMAVVILVVGIWFAGLLSRVIEPVIIRRLKIEPNQARLIRRWLWALLVVCLVMFSLASVKIPLTVFAFAGGALAIGLGFGTQTLLKNFVSGLILLFERPFRVGDVLEIGSQRGIVTEIGLRASVLQLWDGTEILIPNSSLLENNVSNWTYSSPKVRFSLTVGVGYGSDTRRVVQLLSEAAERHGVVEKEPKPQAFFTDFGDSALTFELRYWVDVLKGNAAQVGSDLRQMIAGAFADNAIVIAFPQRDLHLDTTRPLAVEIIGSEKRETPRDAKPRSEPAK
jgi:potassium-dependent mechanosensitive channel